jgi:hypothetical protein
MWPFNPIPHNVVAWLPDTNGIRFDGVGIVLSDGRLHPVAGENGGDSCAVEVYLRPATQDEAGNFLTFSSDENPDAIFLRQCHDLFLLSRSTPTRWRAPAFVFLGENNVLRQGRWVLVTVSSGPDGTSIYVDGKLARNSADFRIRRSELYREIVLGTSPSTIDAWQGEIRGIAIYDDAISPAVASAHYAEWSGDSQLPDAENKNHLLARYNFREGGGNAIHNEVASAPALTIPAHFFLPRKAHLDSVFKQFGWTWMWRRDVLENIVGFMPLGFVLCGFFALSRSRVQAILISTLCGGLLSFSIEFLQYYIPRRDSGWTDVITNSTGTLLGALIAYPGLVRAALRIVHLIPAKRIGEANLSGGANGD